LFKPPRLSISPSNDEVEESSNLPSGLVKRSKISGGKTAPRDKIRFPRFVELTVGLLISLAAAGGGGAAAAAV
jgi:hypothetical protein